MINCWDCWQNIEEDEAHLDPPGGGDSVGGGHHAQLPRDPVHVVQGGGGARGGALTVTIGVASLTSLEILCLQLAGFGPFNFHF